jgi:hypothetical protein
MQHNLHVLHVWSSLWQIINVSYVRQPEGQLGFVTTTSTGTCTTTTSIVEALYNIDRFAPIKKRFLSNSSSVIISLKRKTILNKFIAIFNKIIQ